MDITEKRRLGDRRQGDARVGRSAKRGLPAEGLGAIIGAVVGSAATALLKSSKGQTFDVAEGLKAGAKTAGAIAVGQAGLLAGEAASSAIGLIKDAQDQADAWLASNADYDTMSERERLQADEARGRDNSCDQGR